MIRDLCWLMIVAACLCGWWRSWLNSKAAGKAADERLFAVHREAAMWQGRAEYLSDKVTEDGYEVTWSQAGNLSSMKIDPPEVIKNQFRERTSAKEVGKP